MGMTLLPQGSQTYDCAMSLWFGESSEWQSPARPDQARRLLLYNQQSSASSWRCDVRRDWHWHSLLLTDWHKHIIVDCNADTESVSHHYLPIHRQ